MAAELNITSETLSRMLAGLRGKQLIRTSGKTILVLNRRRLETFMRELLGEAIVVALTRVEEQLLELVDDDQHRRIGGRGAMERIAVTA